MRQCAHGPGKPTDTVGFPWLDNVSFCQLKGASTGQGHPFLHLESLLAAWVSLDLSSDTDVWVQQMFAVPSPYPTPLILMWLSRL